METIPKAACTKIGFIRKIHGVHGETVLEFEPAFEFSVEAAKRFFIELEGLLVPFFVTENRLRLKSGKSALVFFDDVNSESYARRLVGQAVYLFNNEIIDEAEDTNELPFIGFVLKDEKLQEIGSILNVEDFAGNIVLTVDYNGEEIMVPFNEDFLVSVDEELKIMVMKLPLGLIPD